jgi:hypothetical protein
LEALSEKHRSQDVASNKLEKGPLRDYDTAFCLPLALIVWNKKVFKEFAVLQVLGLSMTLK